MHVREKLAAEHLIHEHEDGRVADVRLAKVDEEGRVALLHRLLFSPDVIDQAASDDLRLADFLQRVRLTAV